MCSKIIKTPEKHLPIGEAKLLPDGSPALVIKGKGQVYEVLTLRQLGTMILESTKNYTV